MPERILLIQLRRIGDVLMTTAAVRDLRRAFPRARLVYLTEPPSDQVLRDNPHLDEVWTMARDAGPGEWLRLGRRLRGQAFDVAIDFFSHPKSAVVTRLSGASRRIGFAFRGRRWAYTDPVRKPPGRRYAAEHKALLLAPLGVAPGSPRPEIFPGAEARARAHEVLQALGVRPGDFLVALMPASRQPYKVWPAERFAHLADWLVERHQAKILPLWGPGEEGFVAAVRTAMRRPMLPDYPMPPLMELAALLERADLYVGNDAGPRHFAVALGTPTVGVFGRPAPENWTPPGNPRHRVAAFDPGCKRSCTYPRCDHLECINGVSYEAVRRETETLIERLGHGDRDRR